MMVMCIPPCGEIGSEVHPNTDQLIIVEQGTAVVKIGECESQPDFITQFRQNSMRFGKS